VSVDDEQGNMDKDEDDHDHIINTSMKKSKLTNAWVTLLPMEERIKRAVCVILGRPVHAWRRTVIKEDGSSAPVTLYIDKLVDHPLLMRVMGAATAANDASAILTLAKHIVPISMWLPRLSERPHRNPFQMPTNPRPGQWTHLHSKDAKKLSKLIAFFCHPFTIQHNRFLISVLGSHTSGCSGSWDYGGDNNGLRNESEGMGIISLGVETRRRCASSTVINSIDLVDFQRLVRVNNILCAYDASAQASMLHDATQRMAAYCKGYRWYGPGAGAAPPCSFNAKSSTTATTTAHEFFPHQQLPASTSTRFWIDEKMKRIMWNEPMELRTLALKEMNVRTVNVATRLHGPAECRVRVEGYTVFSLRCGTDVDRQCLQRMLLMYSADVICLQDVSLERSTITYTHTIGMDMEDEGIVCDKSECGDGDFNGLFEQPPGGDSDLQFILDALHESYYCAYAVRHHGTRAELILWNKRRFEHSKGVPFVPEKFPRGGTVMVDLPHIRLCCSMVYADKMMSLPQEFGTYCDVIFCGEFECRDQARVFCKDNEGFVNMYEDIKGEPMGFSSTWEDSEGLIVEGRSKGHVLVRGLMPAVVLRGYSSARHAALASRYVPIVGGVLDWMENDSMELE